MPLTALDIYKVLPKTNCGECGVPTCLAFAMQLATKKAAIDDLAKAVEVFLETRTFQTEDQLRAAFNVYNSLTHTD